MESVFKEFMGKDVKATYTDGQQHRIAKGVIVELLGGFVKIKGDLGTIVINESSIVKLGLRSVDC